MTRISNRTYDEERSLYNLQDATVEDCVFAGPADGESVLKEARRVDVKRCRFSLRYPLWHTQKFLLENCTLDTLTRAPLWYSEDGRIVGCTIEGVKCLRECDRILLERTVARSPEFGWRCRDVQIRDSELESEYLLFETKRAVIDGLRMRGKYSFQYTEDLVIRHSVLDTKDAFWHSKNVTVYDSEVKGEYLGWYSENLTLVRCHISGTQPLCYCKGLKLLDCTMDGTDLSFEYSEVEAEVRGHIRSVKNPKAGHITADSIGEIIREDAVIETDCAVTVRT